MCHIAQHKLKSIIGKFILQKVMEQKLLLIVLVLRRCPLLSGFWPPFFLIVLRDDQFYRENSTVTGAATQMELTRLLGEVLLLIK